jgi:serine/threonine protein kinase
MSPEQLRGLQPDVRSDMYSLGIVLYEIVTGFPPFQVKTLGDALSKHLTARRTATSPLPSVPAGLERLILRAIEKDRANRVQALANSPRCFRRRPASFREAARRWRGSAVAGATERVIPKKDEAVSAPRTSTVSKHFPVSPRKAQQRDLTLPPSEEQKAAFKTPREMSGDSRRIGIVLDRDTLNLVPGQLGVLSVTLMNTGHTVDAFGLTVRGVDESWVQTPSQPQRLNPGQRAVVPLSITVPRKWSSKAGTYVVSVVAVSRMNPGEERSAPATWTVQPFAQTALALSAEGARMEDWRLLSGAQQSGNTRGKYSLSTTDDEKA